MAYKVLMVASVLLHQQGNASRLPDVRPGSAFWCDDSQVAGMVAGGLAVIAPQGTIAPPAEPAWTASQTPGFGKGTSNCSH
jgi:hypothetical protein